jgi:asparagine synthase (glutamine-hydrolysing)
MCGLIGGITRRKIDPGRIQKALDVLEHRGPDGQGRWTSSDGCVFLGHTRLSIIGLENGDQPISNSTRDVHLVVNGEFYGYRTIRDQLRDQGSIFATDSDSEIALHLYLQRGMQATAQLRGEYAVLIADQRRNMMIAIRDRFGIKPLFYAVVDGGVYFASEIKALLALGAPAVWDGEAAYHDAFIFRSHESTMFAGIRSVPQGCYAIARGGEVQIYRYWDWNFPTIEETAADDRSETEVVAGFRDVLSDAVRERLVADVEVGCYLSGGIDSCSVLGLAQKAMGRPIRAFTLAFDDPLYDESVVARRQAEFVGASFHPVPVTRRNLADAYSDAVWHAETPMVNGHGAAKFLLSKAVREAGLKVVFTGEGSDELLGGYATFRRDVLLHHASGRSKQETAAILDKMFASNAATRSIFMQQDPDNPAFIDVRKRLGWLPSFMETFGAMGLAAVPWFRDDLLASAAGNSPYADVLDRLPLSLSVAGRDRLHQGLYINSKTHLANFILTFLGDRMEMAHSIEGRVPFLDHHVADYAAQVPIAMKTKGFREKHVLREAAKDVLIEEVYNREKHPFTSPPAGGEDPMMTMFQDVLASRALDEQPIFDPARARQAFQDMKSCPLDQRPAFEGRIQRVVSTTLMHERFGMSQDARLQFHDLS